MNRASLYSRNLKFYLRFMKRGNYNVFKFMGNDFRSDFKNNSNNS